MDAATVATVVWLEVAVPAFVFEMWGWKWLADWCLRGVDWSAIGRVRWVMRGGPELMAVRTVETTMQVSRQLLYGPGWPSGTARPWPNLHEAMAMAMRYHFYPMMEEYSARAREALGK